MKTLVLLGSMTYCAHIARVTTAVKLPAFKGEIKPPVDNELSIGGLNV